jgi:hypothetical protein
MKKNSDFETNTLKPLKLEYVADSSNENESKIYRKVGKDPIELGEFDAFKVISQKNSKITNNQTDKTKPLITAKKEYDPVLVPATTSKLASRQEDALATGLATNRKPVLRPNKSVSDPSAIRLELGSKRSK